MLSERDRRTLAGIDHWLTDDDPALAGYFRGWTVPAERTRRWPLVVLVVLLCLVMIASAVLGLALGFWAAAMTLSMVIGIRYAHRRRHPPARPS